MTENPGRVGPVVVDSIVCLLEELSNTKERAEALAHASLGFSVGLFQGSMSLSKGDFLATCDKMWNRIESQNK